MLVFIEDGHKEEEEDIWGGHKEEEEDIWGSDHQMK
jgi:hypothetical protein